MPSAELKQVIEIMRARPVIAGGVTVAAMRRGIVEMTENSPIPEGTRCDPVDAGGVPCEWISAPNASADKTLLYLHGGGYVIGSIGTHRGHVARLSQASGARALAVDYRLAPEHPFPAGLEDAQAAYRWLLDQGVRASSLAIAGDSAGGGLSVATLVALRDSGVELPAAGVLLSPWVDLEGVGESSTGKADDDPMIKLDGLLEMAAMYLDGEHARTPLAAPLYADLSGLPPLLIQVGTAEILLDDSTRLAQNAEAAGVEVELEAWEDMIHVWQALAPVVPEATQAVERIGDWLRKRL
ncbi:MAG: alpha/beta hydrolase [Deltaproteobacteria bacterium]|nr:alpha/beta hydrolase [Deltaproteobacteria bacterium]MBW2413945.1 alpha/beta hydrolase [Deltaproteobacteria bacterium]